MLLSVVFISSSNDEVQFEVWLLLALASGCRTVLFLDGNIVLENGDHPCSACFCSSSKHDSK